MLMAASAPSGASARRVHLNLAYRWFYRLDLTDAVPDRSGAFSKNRHGRFRDCDLLRRLFETVLACGIAEGLVGGGKPFEGRRLADHGSRQPRGRDRAGA